MSDIAIGVGIAAIVVIIGAAVLAVLALTEGTKHL